MLERLATNRAGLAVLAAWGFGEAILLPVVPDVLLAPLVALAPRRAAALFGAVLLGALVGTAALTWYAESSIEGAERLVLAVPGIDRPLLAASIERTSDGNPLRMAQLGPGAPLKVLTVAWVEGQGSDVELLLGAVVNRVTRIGPGTVVAAVLGLLAPRFIRRHGRVLAGAYVAAWAVFYWFFLGLG